MHDARDLREGTLGFSNSKNLRSEDQIEAIPFFLRSLTFGKICSTSDANPTHIGTADFFLKASFPILALHWYVSTHNR